MAGKCTKASVHYRHGNAAKHCGICTMFRAPHGCISVEGEIQAADLCDLFKLKRRLRTAKRKGK